LAEVYTSVYVLLPLQQNSNKVHALFAQGSWSKCILGVSCLTIHLSAQMFHWKSALLAFIKI